MIKSTVHYTAVAGHMSTAVVRDMLAGGNPLATGYRLASRSHFG
jgi:hypothetical protein